MLKYLFTVFLLLVIPAYAGPVEQAYGAEPRQNLDVYAATTPCAGGCPVLVWVHGGGWRNGDKAMDNARNIAAAWTAAGVTVVSLNYRLTPDVVHPSHVQDVAAGIAWTKQHISQYGGNPVRLFIMGHSAGAHLVALVATNPDYLNAHGLAPARDLAGVFPIDTASYDLNDNRNNNRMVRGMIEDSFGTDPTVLTLASPLQLVQRGQTYPPFIIAAVKQRADVVRQSYDLSDLLKRSGGQADVMVVDYPFDHRILAAHAHIADDLANLNHSMTKGLYQMVIR